MKTKLLSASMIILVVVISILIMIVPTFFTKGISRVALKKEVDLPLILNDDKDVKLLFFGYSGCTDICTPRLQSLNTFFETLDEDIKQKVGVEFLDISVPSDSELPSRFAEFFNPNFKGIYLESNLIREYTKLFDVYFAQSLMETTEYDHTVNIYIVKKSQNTKELRYVYNSYPYDFKQINSDIRGLLNER
ncbi:MAG: SCO family protein [Campylobacterota bacterium]